MTNDEEALKARIVARHTDGHRSVWPLWVVLAVIFLGGALLAFWVWGLSHKADHANRAADQNAAALQQANSQLRSLGGTPVSTPHPIPTTTITLILTGAPGSAGGSGSSGPRGPRGIPGAPGARGIAGPSGSPGASGSNGSPGVNGIDGSSGPQGEPGVSGQPGVSGSPGPAGESGASGRPGSDGASGSPGQPPSSWTYTDAFGFPHTCSRTDPFDPTTPTYACT